MAIRPVFLVEDSNVRDEFVKKRNIEFEWFPGFSQKQKQKSIQSLHESVKQDLGDINILEISSKSQDDLGIKLSAFNLVIRHKSTNQEFTVESAFQSSKVFEKGGPYKDILNMTSREAKKDERIKSSGKLKYFKFFNTTWELEPKTLFYDWLYINALSKHEHLAKEIVKYNAFTDIEFNPLKSINCQANSAALFVSLFNKGLLEKALNSIDDYMSIIILKNEKKDSEKIDDGNQQLTFEDF